MRPVLGHEADAEIGDLIGRPARHVATLPDHPALAGRREPHDAAHGRGLAHAVAPEEADALTRRHLERHSEEHLGEAVERVDVLHGEERRAAHRRSPR
jgi:hypothetical protein